MTTTTLRAIAGGLLLLAVPVAAAGARESVALIYQISGDPLRIAPGRAPEPLHLLDRLPAKATVELKAGSRLTLAFVTGKRYELTGPARATLGKGDLAARSGGVRALASVPPFPRLEPIAESEKSGAAAGALWIRGERITGLYPRHGVVTLAGETSLHFKPVMGAGAYRIEVRDRQGRTVFQIDTGSSPVKVPRGMLHSGRRYSWTVRTLDRLGPVARGEAELVTLGEDAARAREERREILAPEGVGALPLLAEIDRGLGLLLEARGELRKVAGLEGDPMIQRMLTEIETRLEDQDDPE